jgi:hypothetical protein
MRTLALLTLLTAGCATGDYTDARIGERVQAFRDWCKESVYKPQTCVYMADQIQREEVEYRSSFGRLTDALGGNRRGSATVPVQVRILN